MESTTRRTGIGIPIESFGDGFTWLSKDMDQSAAMAVAQWERCKEAILKGEEDVIVLDEFTYPMHYGWIPVEEVVETLRQRPPELHVIITGRYAPQELIDCADLVTEMKMIKASLRRPRNRGAEGNRVLTQGHYCGHPPPLWQIVKLPQGTNSSHPSYYLVNQSHLHRYGASADESQNQEHSASPQ